MSKRYQCSHCYLHGHNKRTCPLVNVERIYDVGNSVVFKKTGVNGVIEDIVCSICPLDNQPVIDVGVRVKGGFIWTNPKNIQKA